MHLMYYVTEKGDRIYTLKKIDPHGRPTLSAHPGIILYHLSSLPGQPEGPKPVRLVIILYIVVCSSYSTNTV